MNYFLASIILLICGASIYVHDEGVRKDAANEQTINDLGNQLKKVQGDNEKMAEDNEKLQNDKAKLAKNLKDLEEDNVKMGDTTSALNKRLDEALAELTSLEKQIQAAKDVETKPMVQASDESTGEAPIAPVMAATPHPSSSLGTITTLDGKTYQDCRLLKVNPDRIVISYSSGITDILFIFLPPDLQKQFLVNPRPAANFTPAQNQIQQGQKQTADDSSDH